MKRAVATITVYVYGEDVNDLIKEGKQITKSLNDVFGDSQAEMEKLDLVPFGKIGQPQKINFKR